MYYHHYFTWLFKKIDVQSTISIQVHDMYSRKMKRTLLMKNRTENISIAFTENFIPSLKSSKFLIGVFLILKCGALRVKILVSMKWAQIHVTNQNCHISFCLLLVIFQKEIYKMKQRYKRLYFSYFIITIGTTLLIVFTLTTSIQGKDIYSRREKKFT